MVESINGFLKNGKPSDCDKVVEFLESKDSKSFEDPYDEIKTKFLDEILCKCTTLPVESKKSAVGICYSAMHGCGQKFVTSILEKANFTKISSVAEQAEPDEKFTTVRDPNPEVGYETLKLACQTADRNDCKIVLVNDPDADRLALAENIKGYVIHVFVKIVYIYSALLSVKTYSY